MRALGKRPIDRYLTAQAMLDDLRRVQEGETVTTPNGFGEEATRVMSNTAVAAAAGTQGPAQPTMVRARRSEDPAQFYQPEERPERRRAVWPWILVIILIAALGGAAYVILTNWNSAQAEMQTVPGVVGLSEAAAQTKITAEGFKYQKEGAQASADVAEGNVARQDPEQNTKLEKGGTVGYWVSSGAGKVTVQNVVGKDVVEATAILSKQGLDVTTKPEVNPDVQVGTVLRQNPEAQQQVDAGTTVTLTVAAATNTVKVPPLTGMSQENAVNLLKSMGLTSNVQAVDSQLPGGTVDHQDPASGTEVQPGTTVNVYISNQPVSTTVKVPAVAALGLTEAQAKARLAQYGLKAQIVDLETPDFKPGLCIYQDPAAGVEVKIGSTVQITIAREPQTTTTTEPSTTTTTTAGSTTTSST
jgi:serine/threonine-protein kinase